MNIVVINLMRLGDLAQCTPVLRCLKTRFPQATLTLVIMDLFADVGELMPHVDRLLTFPSTLLAEAVDRPGAWPQGCRFLADWLAAHFSPPPDLVVNLTPNLLGGILTFALQGREHRGVAVNQARELSTSPPWASYSFVVSRARQTNPFNLVDLFTLGAGLTPDGLGLHLHIPPQAQSQADADLAALSLPPNTTLVGLVPGASQPQRRWPASSLATVARLLLARRPCHFFIFGSEAEKPLGEEIQGLLPPATTTLFLGRTSIPLLTAYLQRLQLLITNDTGPMHLAAAVGTPVLALFLASARVHDTGPVGLGHIALEPRLDCHPCRFFCHRLRCHQYPSPETVAHWALHLLEKRPLSPLTPPIDTTGLRVYYSTFDPWGFHLHLPLVPQPLDRQHFWLWVHRLVWLQTLGGGKANHLSLLQWAKELLTRHYLPPVTDLGLEQIRKNLQELLDLSFQGEDLAGRILTLAANPSSAPVRLWQQGEALRHLDPHLRRLAVDSPELASFIEFFFQEQRGELNTDILPLASALQAAYRRLRQTGEICLQVATELSGIFPEIMCQKAQLIPLAHLVHKNLGNMPYHP